MNELLTYEAGIRLSIFFALLAILASLEYAIPKRELSVSKSVRWSNNIGLLAVDIIFMRLLLPAGAIGTALYAAKYEFGLLHYLAIPFFIKVISAVIFLDFIIYWQHRIFHWVPIFWRIHAVHHSDKDFDVTTAVRFHPVEILLSMLIKCSVVFLLGIPVLSVVIFEILLNSFAMFNHSNLKLPAMLEKYLQKIIVTPDMHRIHHSIDFTESNRNFGFMLSIWDKCFLSFLSKAKKNQSEMPIGIENYRDNSKIVPLLSLLKMPLDYTPNGKNK